MDSPRPLIMGTMPFLLGALILLTSTMSAQDRHSDGADTSNLSANKLSLADSHRSKGDYLNAELVLRKSLAAGVGDPQALRSLQYDLGDLLREEARATEA